MTHFSGGLEKSDFSRQPACKEVPRRIQLRSAACLKGRSKTSLGVRKPSSFRDLTIAADASGTLSDSVTNLSGDIEAGNDIFIATHQFTNQRRLFDAAVYSLTG